MTNEQLASFIKQGGSDELIPILWERVRPIFYKFADRYYKAYPDYLSQYGITVWDLKQQGYNALLKAVSGYDESKGFKFSSYLRYSFKNTVRILLTKDTLNKSDSLNKTVGNVEDNEQTEAIDLLADETALDFTEAIESQSVYAVVRNAVNELPSEQQSFIRERFYNNKTLSSIAADKGKSKEAVRQYERKIIAKLKKNKNIRRLGDELGYTSKRVYTNSLNSYMRTGISNVELIAIQRADIEQRITRREELREAYTKGEIEPQKFIEEYKKLI